MRSIQDWTIRYGISKAEGIAEVASVGGFVRQYNVIVEPNRLDLHDFPQRIEIRARSRSATSTITQTTS